MTASARSQTASMPTMCMLSLTCSDVLAVHVNPRRGTQHAGICANLNACMQQRAPSERHLFYTYHPLHTSSNFLAWRRGAYIQELSANTICWQCRYNDLGGKDAATNAANRRPILGKGRGGTLSYPRRLRTGRPLDQYNDEANPVGGCSTLSSIALYGGTSQSTRLLCLRTLDAAPEKSAPASSTHLYPDHIDF